MQQIAPVVLYFAFLVVSEVPRLSVRQAAKPCFNSFTRLVHFSLDNLLSTHPRQGQLQSS